MAQTLNYSVGKGGPNRADDVKKVIQMLNLAQQKVGSNKKVDPANGQGLLEAICDFQWFHFKLVTKVVAPNSATLDKLNEVAFGERGLHALVEFPRMVATWREMILRVASFEAKRADRVPGIDATGKHTEQGKNRLKEYFQKVYPGAQSWSEASFYDPTPKHVAWCGVFASWVLTQAMIPVQWAIADNIWGMRWTTTAMSGSLVIPMAKDRYYTKGDVLVVRERADGKDPTHHIIVEDEVPDKNGNIATIEGNIPDFFTQRKCSVTRNKRPAEAYTHYCPFLPKVL